jgi:hypothetical protein
VPAHTYLIQDDQTGNNLEKLARLSLVIVFRFLFRPVWAYRSVFG